MASERHRVAVVVVVVGIVGVLGVALPWVATAGLELDVHSVHALVASTAVATVDAWSRRTQFAAAVTTAFALEAVTDFAGDGPPPGVAPAATSPGVGAYLALAGAALARTTT